MISKHFCIYQDFCTKQTIPGAAAAATLAVPTGHSSLRATRLRCTHDNIMCCFLVYIDNFTCTIWQQESVSHVIYSFTARYSAVKRNQGERQRRGKLLVVRWDSKIELFKAALCFHVIYPAEYAILKTHFTGKPLFISR